MQSRSYLPSRVQTSPTTTRFIPPSTPPSVSQIAAYEWVPENPCAPSCDPSMLLLKPHAFGIKYRDRESHCWLEKIIY